MNNGRITKEQWPAIANLYKSGFTQKEIGERHGVSGSRIQQILKLMGVDSFLGGVSLRAFDKTRAAIDAANARRDDRCFATYKCSHADAFALNGNKNISDETGLARRYIQQRNHARTRGIEFKLSFPEWVALWQDSGYLASRGRGEGYCMARVADQGAYEIGNVYFCTIGENFSHSYIASPWHERRKDAISSANERAAR